jgi:short-subunit dehydrogenase
VRSARWCRTASRARRWAVLIRTGAPRGGLIRPDMSATVPGAAAAGIVVIMTQLAGAHVLVIGATGGLGAAISRELAAVGSALILSGRSQPRLDALTTELGGAVLGSLAGDLVAPDVPARLVSQAHAIGGHLDGLIFAAGVVAFGELGNLDDDVLDELMLVNLIAPIRLARAAVGVLPAGGFLANISAVVAEQPQKSMAAYSATKAGLTGFDRALTAELRRRQIRVLDIRPTHTETGLADRPIAGEAPRLPVGARPDMVAKRIVQAIVGDERDLPASAFDQS